MPLDDLPLEIRANGIRRRREALGLTAADVAAGCSLLPLSVEKAEQGLAERQTYLVLEDWLEGRERGAEVAPRAAAAPAWQAMQRQPAMQQQQHVALADQPCQFELSMDGITITARGPADKIEAMGAIIRGSMSALVRERRAPPHTPSHRG